MEHPSHDEYYKSDVARAKLSRIRVSPARTRSSVFIFNERTPPPNYRDYSTRFRAKYLMSTSYAQSTDYPIDFSAQLTIRHTWVIIGYEIGRRSIRWNRAEVRFLAVTPPRRLQRGRFTTRCTSSFSSRSARESVADAAAVPGTARGCCCCANSCAAGVAGTVDDDAATLGSNCT